MSQLFMTFAWGAVQVSLVMVVGAVVYRCARRRGPAAASFSVATTLGAVLVASLLASLPCPRWSDWTGMAGDLSRAGTASIARGAEAFVAGQETGLADSIGFQGQGGLVGPSYLRAVSAWLASMNQRESAAVHSVSCLLIWIVLPGVCLALARLGLGLWGVRRCRIASRPVDDPQLRGLVDSLRAAMGCRRRIALGETAELAGAATVGWRRPLVLLPRDWTTWSEAELRAVLAHEIAHVCGGDYLAGVVARLSVALHVYHPLAHWLAGRLRLEQELAADALGARFGGGRAAYLRVLSRMAIRQEERPLGLARMFLAGEGTLIRRIEMLRDDRRFDEVALRRGARMALAAPLVIVALLASGLRGGNRQAQAGEAVDEDRTPRLEKLVLPYLPPDCQGLAVIRPAAAFRHPGMKPQAERVKTLLESVLPGSKLRIEDIEMVAGGVYLEPRRFIMKGISARTSRPFDWKSEVERLFKHIGRGKMIAATHGGLSYYQLKDLPPLGADGAVLFPDDRTIVVYPEKSLLTMIDAGDRNGPDFARGVDWTRIDGTLATYVMDSRAVRFNPRADEVKDLEDRTAFAIFAIVEKSDLFTISVADRDHLDLRVVATPRSEQAAPDIVRAGNEIKALNLKQPEGPHDCKKPNCDHAPALRMARALWEALRVKTEKNSVELRAETRVDLSEVMAALIAGQLL